MTEGIVPLLSTLHMRINDSTTKKDSTNFSTSEVDNLTLMQNVGEDIFNRKNLLKNVFSDLERIIKPLFFKVSRKKQSHREKLNTFSEEFSRE